MTSQLSLKAQVDAVEAANSRITELQRVKVVVNDLQRYRTAKLGLINSGIAATVVFGAIAGFSGALGGFSARAKSVSRQAQAIASRTPADKAQWLKDIEELEPQLTATFGTAAIHPDRITATARSVANEIGVPLPDDSARFDEVFDQAIAESRKTALEGMRGAIGILQRLQNDGKLPEKSHFVATINLTNSPDELIEAMYSLVQKQPETMARAYAAENGGPSPVSNPDHTVSRGRDASGEMSVGD